MTPPGKCTMHQHKNYDESAEVALSLKKSELASASAHSIIVLKNLSPTSLELTIKISTTAKM